MLKTLRNAFKVKDVRDRLLYMFAMLVVIRIGSQLPIPGVDTSFFKELFASQNNDAFGFFNAMTGSSFTNMSVFALSITPYITSSIIMQLLTIAIPKQRATVEALGLKKLHKTVEMPDNGAVRGMIATVRHLVKVEEV